MNRGKDAVWQEDMLDQQNSNANSAEASFLIGLFQQLNDSAIPYCVLRNYNTLPYSLGGSDIDLLVSGDSLATVFDIVNKLAHMHGGRCISYFKVMGIICRFCGKDKKNRTWWGVPIDIFPFVGLRQKEHFDAESVLSNSLVYRNIRVASPDDAAIIAFLKECVAHGRSRKNYEKEAATAYASNRSRYKKRFEKYFGTRMARQWSKYLLCGGDAKTLRQISRRARYALSVKAILRKPLGSMQNTFVCIWRRYSRLFHPPGFAVVVMGTDGSGKSTIIESIRPVIETALHSKVFYEHMRPNLLLSLARLFGRPVNKGPTTDPHAGKPSGLLCSLIRLSYYSTDYVIGYWLKVFPALVKWPCMYLFDRYYYDYLIDPYRGRIKLPKWIIAFVGLFIPRPDIILCLDADPEVIHARKPELPLEEVKRQIDALRQFCDKNKRAVWIDTGCSIEKSVDQALEAITSRMAARYE